MIPKDDKGSTLPIIPEGIIGYISVKEVFHPQVLLRIPCYDLAPVKSFALGRVKRTSGAPFSHSLTGGEYKAQEHIQRAVADTRLLANPTS